MSLFTCPLCGERMAAEFADIHYMVVDLEERLVDVLGKLYPHWHTAEGTCPDCVEFLRVYRETFVMSPAGGRGREALEEVVSCPLCGYEVYKEELLFHQQLEEILFERLQRLNPEWVGNDGECPLCATYLAKVVAAAVAESPAPHDEAA